MRRLTTKKTDKSYYAAVEKDGNKIDMTPLGEVVNKLGRLEDIEEELRFPITTLFKVLDEGAFFKDCEGKIVYRCVRSVDKYGIYAVDGDAPIRDCDLFFYFSEYGKTWALTEKELEK